MNKQELIEKVNSSVKNPMTHADAERFVNAVFGTIKEAVAAGDSVQLVGFGTFEARERAARTARNPQDGTQIQVAAKKVPAFKAGKAFKDIVNK